MAQRPVPYLSEFSKPQERAPGDHPVAGPSGELRIEHSRFSRLLARFGLGELTVPILRPTKHPAERAAPAEKIV